MDSLLLISLSAAFLAGAASCWAIVGIRLQWLSDDLSSALACIRAVRSGIRDGVKPLVLMRITEDCLGEHCDMRPARIREVEGGSDA